MTRRHTTSVQPVLAPALFILLVVAAWHVETTMSEDVVRAHTVRSRTRVRMRRVRSRSVVAIVGALCAIVGGMAGLPSSQAALNDAVSMQQVSLTGGTVN